MAAYSLAMASVILGVAIFPMLPALVPTHWNAFGQVDAFGPSWVGAFLIPALMIFIALLFAGIPKIDVMKENFKHFKRPYWALCFVIELFFLILFELTLLPNFGFSFNFFQFLLFPAALLFISIGFLLPSFKRNFFVGIRTPWTLSSDEVWDKTHRFGGKAFFFAGTAIIASLPYPKAILIVTIAVTVSAVANSVLFSFLEFRKIEKELTPTFP